LTCDASTVVAAKANARRVAKPNSGRAEVKAVAPLIIWPCASSCSGACICAGNARVSTIFLGLDRRFEGEGPPILFETMVFGGKHDQYQERCATWDEAEAMHQPVEMVRQLRVVK
jgi:hypothetical protein